MKRVSTLIAASLAVSLTANTAPAQTPTTAAQPVAATAADIKPAASIRDVNGAPVGTVVSGTDQQVVVDTGQTKIGVPLNLFRKDDKGLLLGVTAQQFNDAIAKAHARSQAAQVAKQPATQPPQQPK